MQPRAVAELLATVDATPASYLRVARELDAPAIRETLISVRAGVLATFTFDTMTPYLAVEGARHGLSIATTVAPFGQLEQIALDPVTQYTRQTCS